MFSPELIFSLLRREEQKTVKCFCVVTVSWLLCGFFGFSMSLRLLLLLTRRIGARIVCYFWNRKRFDLAKYTVKDRFEKIAGGGKLFSIIFVVTNRIFHLWGVQFFSHLDKSYILSFISWTKMVFCASVCDWRWEICLHFCRQRLDNSFMGSCFFAFSSNNFPVLSY